MTLGFTYLVLPFAGSPTMARSKLVLTAHPFGYLSDGLMSKRAMQQDELWEKSKVWKGRGGKVVGSTRHRDELREMRVEEGRWKEGRAGKGR